MSVTATQAEAAKALIQFLSSPAAASVIKAKGMEPG
jgi:ABC-type molybdate transport system substrate-binding protein